MRKNATGQLVLSALMCALIAVLSQILIPLPPIPISLSLLGVYLCGALLPVRWSVAAVASYLLLGALGVPVYAGFCAGPSILLGSTGGYLIGYVPCAALVGLLIDRLGFSRRSLALSIAVGTAACYALGTAWFMSTSGSSFFAALSACVLPFLPGDALKTALAVSLALRLRKPLAALGLCA